MCLHEKNNRFAQSDTNALAFFFAARYNADMQYQPNKLRSVLCVKEIYTIHYFKYARGFAAKGESHDFWEMVYIDGGAAEIVAGERRFVLKQGEAVFHKPNEFHNILTHDKFANSVIVSFAGMGRGLDALEKRIFTLTDAEKELLNGLVLEGSENFSDRLDDMYLQKMNKKPDAPFGGEQIIKNTLELLLISLIRGTKNAAPNVMMDVPQNNALCAEIVQILQENVYGSVTLDEIAAKVFFSKTYVKQVFARQMHESVMQYYTRLKMEEAKRLLSENKLSVTQIAYLLRFNSIHYFSRAFKKYENLSPTEYVRSTKLDKLI